MRDSILFVELGIDATNDDILDQMRKMKSCREDRSYSNIVCTVRGFADDKRHLFEIPEARAFRRQPPSLQFVQDGCQRPDAGVREGTRRGPSPRWCNCRTRR